MMWRRSLAWQIEFADGALKDLFRPEKHAAWCIIDFLRERMVSPEETGKIIQSAGYSRLGEFRQYRVGKYRIVVKIENLTVYVLSVKIGYFPNNKKEKNA